MDSSEKKLNAAIKLHGGPRAKRLLLHPYRSLYPLYLRKSQSLRPMNTTTFFGSGFSGVLPEAVSTQVWRTGYFCPEVCRTLMTFLKPGMRFVDIGAHFGFFSLLASHLVGENGAVFSIEAMPSTFGYLQNNITRNATAQNVRLHQGAAFNKSCELVFKDFGIIASSLNTTFSNRGDEKLLSEPKMVNVQAEKADLILKKNNFTNPSLIKIDAESSERFVLEGLEDTLKKYKPSIVLEIGDDETSEISESSIINKFLKGFGYRAHVWDNNKLTPFTFPDSIPYANLVYIAD